MSADEPGTAKAKSSAKAVGALAIAELAGKAASFVMFALAARELGVDDFGVFSWAFAIGMLANSFVVWGFDMIQVREGSKHPETVPATLVNTLAMRAVMGVVALAIVMAATRGDPESTPAVMFLITVACLVDTVNDSVRAAAAALRKLTMYSKHMVVQRLITATLAVAVLLAGGGLVAFSAAYCLGTILGVLWMMWVSSRLGAPIRWREIRWPTMKWLLWESRILGIFTVVNMAVFRIDTVMLGTLGSVAEVGYYAVAYKLFETVLFIIWSVARVAAPEIASAQTAKSARKAYEVAVATALSLMTPYTVLLIVSGGAFAALLFGAEYEQGSAAATAWLGLALIPYTVQYLSASAAIARGHNNTVLIASVVALVVNVGLNLWLIPLYGSSGAAFATMATIVVQCGVLLITVWRSFEGISLWRPAIHLPIAGLAMVPVLMAIAPILIAAPLAAVLYVVVWFGVGKLVDPGSVKGVLALVRKEKPAPA
ncbi:MAG: flippase [Candidatus Nanopelagicales bacterium]|mgnify:FL=1